MDSRPNIVLFMTDQQRGDCLGIDGHPVLQTPNLDELAARGARFRHAYTAAATVLGRLGTMGGPTAVAMDWVTPTGGPFAMA